MLLDILHFFFALDAFHSTNATFDAIRNFFWKKNVSIFCYKRNGSNGLLITNQKFCYRTLQNNQLKTVPSEAIHGLSALQSL